MAIKLKTKIGFLFIGQVELFYLEIPRLKFLPPFLPQKGDDLG